MMDTQQVFHEAEENGSQLTSASFCATCYGSNANTYSPAHQDPNWKLGSAIHVIQLTTKSIPPTLTPSAPLQLLPSPNLLKER